MCDCFSDAVQLAEAQRATAEWMSAPGRSAATSSTSASAIAAPLSKAVGAQCRDLTRQGIYLWCVPACRPEPNRIEPVFQQVKYQEIPMRNYTSRAAIHQAVEHRLDSCAKNVGEKARKQLRSAAEATPA